jgi:hypothetical protein
MADLTEQQMKERDIDWFCLINGHPSHMASMGGVLPGKFRNREVLRRQQDLVAQIQPFVDAQLNINNIQTQLKEGYEYLRDQTINSAIVEANRDNPVFLYLKDYDLPVRLFASTFVEMARRGFWSYVRRDDVENNEYLLIAEPVGPVGYEWKPLRLMELEYKQGVVGNSIIIRNST